MKIISLNLAPQQLARLRMLKTVTGLSVAEHIRRAIDDYLMQAEEHERILTAAETYHTQRGKDETETVTA